MLPHLRALIEKINHPQKHWRFRVSKLGALTYGGDFEIKPLTLFCGENNANKTWVMYATYSFLQKSRHLYISTSRLLAQYSRDVVPHEDPTKTRFPYKESLKEAYNKILALTNRGMSRGLPSLFNADESLFKGAKFECLINEDILMEKVDQINWQRKFLYSEGNMITFKKEKGAEDIELVSNGNIDMDPKRTLSLFNRFFLTFISSTVSDLIGCRRVFLMPAERNGLQLLYRELRTRRTALLHHASKKDIDLDDLLYDVKRSRYAAPIADYINWLNMLSDRNPKGEYSEIAQELAIKIAGGKYRVDREGNIFFTPRNNKGEDAEEMELQATSSTVKSIFGLWYYLQHDARAGDVLMIDEPELNLHPSNQLLLARLLAQLVNGGLFVVASTHSDYIVREINTMLMLNRNDAKRESLMKKYKINEIETINPNLVGAYEMSAKTGRIEPMKMDKEGINAKTLDEVIVAQGEENDEVHYSLAK